jgi:hypothetical protein
MLDHHHVRDPNNCQSGLALSGHRTFPISVVQAQDGLPQTNEILDFAKFAIDPLIVLPPQHLFYIDFWCKHCFECFCVSEIWPVLNP